jgi:hypothetical protein
MYFATVVAAARGLMVSILEIAFCHGISLSFVSGCMGFLARWLLCSAGESRASVYIAASNFFRPKFMLEPRNRDAVPVTSYHLAVSNIEIVAIDRVIVWQDWFV